jgi:hypothetical protein
MELTPMCGAGNLRDAEPLISSSVEIASLSRMRKKSGWPLNTKNIWARITSGLTGIDRSNG